MSEFKDWYYSVPFFTRYWLSFTIILSLIGRFGIINYGYLVLDFYPFINQFQIWRPLTALFFYPIGPGTGFHFLINCYFLYNYSQRLETGIFAGKPADYFYMLLFNWACCVVIGILVNLPILMDPMVLSVLYVWCQLNKDVIVSFWFGTRFKAMYLPWVLLAFNLVLSGGKQIFPDTRYVGGFGTAPQARVAERPAGGTVFGRHNWGRGQTLGGN
ncbi:Derlin-1 [Papilio machaon]|uniref:Derlin n=1 Tax=Papilio machaon TaxID=76193 RepID=A0A0N1IGV5_PAPMA|nr:Derlin-1 [Papilio machaon]